MASSSSSSARAAAAAAAAAMPHRPSTDTDFRQRDTLCWIDTPLTILAPGGGDDTPILSIFPGTKNILFNTVARLAIRIHVIERGLGEAWQMMIPMKISARHRGTDPAFWWDVSKVVLDAPPDPKMPEAIKFARQGNKALKEVAVYEVGALMGLTATLHWRYQLVFQMHRLFRTPAVVDQFQAWLVAALEHISISDRACPAYKGLTAVNDEASAMENFLLGTFDRANNWLFAPAAHHSRQFTDTPVQRACRANIIVALSDALIRTRDTFAMVKSLLPYTLGDMVGFFPFEVRRAVASGIARIVRSKRPGLSKTVVSSVPEDTMCDVSFDMSAIELIATSTPPVYGIIDADAAVADMRGFARETSTMHQRQAFLCMVAAMSAAAWWREAA